MTTHQKSNRHRTLDAALASLENGDPSEAADELNKLHAVQLCEKYTACPPLVGLQGFAEILGVSYQAVQIHLKTATRTYSPSPYSRRRPKVAFPLPVAELPQPVWLRAQAVAYRDAVRAAESGKKDEDEMTLEELKAWEEVNGE